MWTRQETRGISGCWYDSPRGPQPLEPGWKGTPERYTIIKALPFSLLIVIYCSIFALQCCVSFYCIAKQTSHTHLSSLLDFSPV